MTVHSMLSGLLDQSTLGEDIQAINDSSARDSVVVVLSAGTGLGGQFHFEAMDGVTVTQAPDTGFWQFEGSVGDVSSVLNTLSFEAASGYDGLMSLHMEVRDGDGETMGVQEVELTPAELQLQLAGATDGQPESSVMAGAEVPSVSDSTAGDDIAYDQPAPDLVMTVDGTATDVSYNDASDDPAGEGGLIHAYVCGCASCHGQELEFEPLQQTGEALGGEQPEVEGDGTGQETVEGGTEGDAFTASGLDDHINTLLSRSVSSNENSPIETWAGEVLRMDGSAYGYQYVYQETEAPTAGSSISLTYRYNFDHLGVSNDQHFSVTHDNYTTYTITTGSAVYNAYEAALNLWANVANITFTEVTSGDADIGLNMGAMPSGIAGVAFTPSYTASYGYADEIVSHNGHIMYSDVYVDNDLDFGVGDYGFTTIIHEIGHALGLKHPGDYNAAGSGTGPFLSVSADSTDYSIMSYESEVNSASDYTTDGWVDGVWVQKNPESPMLSDIAAIQHLYGANSSYNSGNTTITFGGDYKFWAIWDGGGTDTLNASGVSGDHTLDLRAGNAYANVVGNEVAWVAYNANIENATGGSGNDGITGNDLGNVLTGGEGNDTLDGGSGNDTLDGGGGTDTYTVSTGDGHDAISDSDGTGSLIIDGDTIAGTATSQGGGVHHLVVDGTTYVLTESGNDLVVTIQGNSNDSWRIQNFTSGDLGIEVSSVNNDNTTLTGSDGADELETGSGDDLISGGAGNDTITSAGGTDTIDGGMGDDSIFASGRMVITGGSGDDTVTITNAVSGASTITLGPGSNVLEESGTIAFNDTATMHITAGHYGDTITYTRSDATVTGGAGTDNITLGDGDDSVNGTTGGADTVDAGNGNNTIVGGSAGDSLEGGSGNDSIDGGAGNDTITSTGGTDTLSGGIGDDLITASGTLTITTGGGSDTVNINGAMAGDSSIVFGSGTNNVLQESGSVSYNASAGMDITLSHSGDVVTYSRSDTTVTGGAGADDITTGQGDDSIVGTFGGADTIDAGDGDNTVVIGSTGSSVTTGSGNDTITGDVGNDTIDAGGGVNSIDGGQGNDSISASGHMEIIAGNGDDIITINGAVSGDSTILLGPGTNTVQESGGVVFNGAATMNITAGHYGDTITYTRSVATVTGGAGADNITTGDGDDSIDATARGGDTIDGGNGNNTVIGSSADESITTGSGNDSIVAGQGNDTIDAGAGVNTIDAGQGNDSVTAAGQMDITAGNGDDIITINGVVSGASTITLGSGTNTVQESGSVVFDGTATMHITAGHYGDTITYSRSDATVVGGIGADDITLGDGNDSVNASSGGADTIDAGNGNNTVIGGSAGDSISAGSGNDTVDGGQGNDTITSSGGTDTLAGGFGDDLITASGEMTITTGAGSDTVNINGAVSGNSSIVFGHGANNELEESGSVVFNASAGMDITLSHSGDVMTYTRSDVTVTGGAGADDITTGQGDDSIDGAHGGADTIDAGAGDDTVMGGRHNDSITGGNGNDSMLGGNGDDDIIGGEGDDYIDGMANDDSLEGGAGADTMIGGSYSDTLAGGSGVDSLSGGSGTDYFVFTADSDSGTGDGNRDIIADLNYWQNDRIDLSAFAGAFSFIGTGAFSGSGNEVRYYQLSGPNRTIVEVDSDGNGATNFEIELAGALNLAGSDFIL